MGVSVDDLAALIRLSGGPCPDCGSTLAVETQWPASTARLTCGNGHDHTPDLGLRD
jgi:hypothetical protein